MPYLFYKTILSDIFQRLGINCKNRILLRESTQGGLVQVCAALILWQYNCVDLEDASSA